MDAEELRKCLKFHENSSSDEESDEEAVIGLYERYKPPPILIDEQRHRIIEVGLSSEEEVEKRFTKGQKKRKRKALWKQRRKTQENGGNGSEVEAENLLENHQKDDESRTTEDTGRRTLEQEDSQLYDLHQNLASIIPRGMEAPMVFSAVDIYLQGLQKLNIPLSMCTLCLCTILQGVSVAYAPLINAVRLRQPHLNIAEFFNTVNTAILGSVKKFNFKSELDFEASPSEELVYSNLCGVLFDFTNRIMQDIEAWTGFRFPNPVFPDQGRNGIPRSYFLALAEGIRDPNRGVGQTALHLIDTTRYPLDWLLRSCTTRKVLVALVFLLGFKHFFVLFMFFIRTLFSFSDLAFLLAVLLYLCSYFVVNFS